MPILNKRIRNNNKRVKHSDKTNNLDYKYVYNTGTWRKLRLFYLTENPLCKRCLKEGIIKSAIDVHHIIPLSNAKGIVEKKMLGFNIDNLEGLCKIHHQHEHKK